MNIVFLYSEAINPHKGGVERVTRTLADFFENKGNSVFFISKNKSDSIDNRQFFLPDPLQYCSIENINYLYGFIESNKVDIIINQGALLEDITEFAFYAKNKNVKVISIVHNSLLSIPDNFASVYHEFLKSKHIQWLTGVFNISVVKKIIKRVYISKKKEHYIKLIQKSDILAVLSPSFIDELFQITGQHSDNIVAVPNPILIPPKVQLDNKINRVIYVGRVNTIQKRVDLLLEIWKNIAQKHNDWYLYIIGDGPDKERLSEYIKATGLQNVFFEGTQDPIPYYVDSSIFCMTSSFEGMPMTLLEAMSFGVVPVLFNSFSSASDIIEDGVNGFLVSPFDMNAYVHIVETMMNEREKRKQCANCAINNSLKYSIEIIGEKWVEIFNSL